MRKAPCWFDSNDRPHATLQQCQVAELMKILTSIPDNYAADQIAESIVKNADAVMNILNVTSKSRLGARKLNGARRKKRYEAEQKTLPLPETVPAPTKPF